MTDRLPVSDQPKGCFVWSRRGTDTLISTTPTPSMTIAAAPTPTKRASPLSGCTVSCLAYEISISHSSERTCGMLFCSCGTALLGVGRAHLLRDGLPGCKQPVPEGGHPHPISSLVWR